MHAFHTPWPVQGGESSESSGRQRQRAIECSGLSVVIPSHDPNVIFSLANNRTSVIVFY
jgi:hypothetical protein